MQCKRTGWEIMFLGHLTSLYYLAFFFFPCKRPLRQEKISVNVLRSRFTRDFLWYHILSGKIITFSLPVMYIYILKAEQLFDACGIISQVGEKKFVVNMGQWYLEWCQWLDYAHKFDGKITEIYRCVLFFINNGLLNCLTNKNFVGHFSFFSPLHKTRREHFLRKKDFLNFFRRNNNDNVGWWKTKPENNNENNPKLLQRARRAQNLKWSSRKIS